MVAWGYQAQEPKLADTVTIHLTAAGSDANDGLTSNTGVATFAKALSSLPVVNGVITGIIQFGGGQYTVASLPGTPAMSLGNTDMVQLRGPGQAEQYTPGTVPAPVYLCEITDTGTGTTLAMTGLSDASQVQSVTGISFVTTTAVNAVTCTNGTSESVQNCSIDGYSAWGIILNNFVGPGPFADVGITRCGNAEATTPTGGVYLDVTPAYAVQLARVGCTNCIGFGVYAAGGAAVSVQNSLMQGTTASEAANSGTGLWVAGSSNGAGPYNVRDTWFESNALYGAGAASGSGVTMKFDGCQFAGDSVQQYGIFAGGQATIVMGCNFLNHVHASIDNPDMEAVIWIPGSSSDAVLIANGATSVPQNSALQVCIQGCGVSTGYFAQTLTTNGPVIFYPAAGNVQAVTLDANATSSTVDNSAAPPVIGQVTHFVWIIGIANKTYAWPTNFKFTGGSAPAASTTAGYKDSVTAWWDGTNWNELARSPADH